MLQLSSKSTVFGQNWPMAYDFRGLSEAIAEILAAYIPWLWENMGLTGNSPNIWSQSWANKLTEREGGGWGICRRKFACGQVAEPAVAALLWLSVLPHNLTAVLSCLLSQTPFLWHKRGWVFCWSPSFTTLGHREQRIKPLPPPPSG